MLGGVRGVLLLLEDVALLGLVLLGGLLGCGREVDIAALLFSSCFFRLSFVCGS